MNETITNILREKAVAPLKTIFPSNECTHCARIWQAAFNGPHDADAPVSGEISGSL
jgi:hypothetical protein